MAKKEVLFSLDEKGVLTIAPGVTEITQMDIAAFDATAIKEAVIPNSVTKIGESAFLYTDLEKVVIPESVTTIGDYAFKGTMLKSVVIPESVTTIGDFAFEGTNLKSVVIPKSVTKLECSVFEDSSLEEVSLHSELTEIGREAFRGTRLKRIEIPEGVTEISYNAFDGTDIEELKIPSGVKKVDCSGMKHLKSIDLPGGLEYCSFDNCTELKSINLPDGLEYCPSFENCTELESVVLPDSITELDRCRFKGCTSLKSVTLSKNIKTIGEGCFIGCPLEKIELPEGLEEIGGAAFADTLIKEIEIPSTVTKIEGNPFQGKYDVLLDTFDGVIDVNIKTKGDRFTFDGEYLVDREEKKIVYVRPTIKEFNVPEGIERMYNISFIGFKSLETVEFPEMMTAIGDFGKLKPLYVSCSGCTMLKRVKLPTRGQGNFEGCTSLEKLIISSSAKYNNMNLDGINADIEIYDDSHLNLNFPYQNPPQTEYDGRVLSFRDWDRLGRMVAYARPVSKELVIEDGSCIYTGKVGYYDTAGIEDVERIVNVSGSLQGLKNLKSVEIRHFLSVSDCPSLKEVKIVGDTDFGFTGEQDLDIKIEGKAVYDGTILYNDDFLYYCKMSAEHVVVPEGITKIGSDAFRKRTNLKSVVLPSTLKYIYEGAFMGCTSLENVTIPAGCAWNEIKENTFAGCSSLESITMPDSCTEINFSAFNECGIKKLTIGKGVRWFFGFGRGNIEFELETSSLTYEEGVLVNSEGRILYVKDTEHVVIPKSVKNGFITFLEYLNPNVKSITLLSGAAKLMEAFARADENLKDLGGICGKYKELEAIYVAPASVAKTKDYVIRMSYNTDQYYNSNEKKLYRMVKPIVKEKKGKK